MNHADPKAKAKAGAAAKPAQLNAAAAKPAQPNAAAAKPAAAQAKGYDAQKAQAAPKPAAPEAGAASATKTAQNFYAGLAARDVGQMAACYDKGAQFHDPLFKNLNGVGEVMDMWKTITPAANPATFKVASKLQGAPLANGDGSYTVNVHWDASYDLGKRHVDNHADSTLVIKDRKIISQRDDWDLGAWMKQALPVGGGSTVVQETVAFAAHSFIEIKAFFEKHHV